MTLPFPNVGAPLAGARHPLLLLLLLTAPAFALDRQLGPSSHRTPLTISEIMYHPAGPAPDGREFVEIRNTEPAAFDLGGCRLTGDIGYTFPTGAILPALGFVVVAADPAALADATGVTNAFGPFTNRLSDAGGRVTFENRWGANLLGVTYDDDPPWPVAADGAGHSLVLARPDLGEAAPAAWNPSHAAGGSPGTADPTHDVPLRNVVINEFLAHSDPGVDRIELYNRATQALDISGCRLCDEPGDAGFTIPTNTVLAPGGFITFDETTLGFRLDSGGDDLFWIAPDGSNVLDAIRFQSQQLEVSSGRFPDGAPGFHPLTAQTFAQPNTNAALRLPDVVINEIMYRSVSGDADDEFVELLNRSAAPVDVSLWQLDGGVRYTFPPGTTIATGACLVVAHDAARLIARYLQLNAANTVGDFDGTLADGGERVALTRLLDPTQPARGYVVVDEVTYGDGADWGQWTDGGGSSLELTDPRADNRQAANWAGSDETRKALWTTIEHTGVLDNGSGTNDELDVYLLNAGECLVDNIEFIRQGETNNRVAPAQFESGLDEWAPLGDHTRSTRESGEGDTGSGSLHIRASGPGRTTTSSYLVGHYDRVWKEIAPPPSTGQVFTVRARARWLCGWPYLGISVKGFWLEAVGQMHVPANPGTPGLPNSRLLTNAPPAMWDLAHTPLLPAADQPVEVSCRAHDPDGLALVELRYRIDTNATYTTVAMQPESPGGTGRWRAAIPGQPAGALIGFYVTARDAAPLPRERALPGTELTRNALVRVGEPPLTSTFGTYIFWVSAANVSALAQRVNQSNEPVDGTFLYDGCRPIYNMLLRYRGNFRRFSGITDAAYAIELPCGDEFLGEREIKVDVPSLQTLSNNGTRQQERHGYWMAESIGQPASCLRYIRARVNGSDLFRHDLQPPTRDFSESWYGDDDPWIHKEEKPLDPLGVYATTGGVKKASTYSFIMTKNRTRRPDYDFSSLYRLVDALAQTNGPTFVARVAALTDMRSWSAYFGANRAAGNEDSYGYGSTFLHNMYAYLTPGARSRLHLYDLDGAFTTENNTLLPGSGNVDYPVVQRLYRTAPFERVYWRVLQEFAEGPMVPAHSDARLDAWYQVLTNDGQSVNSPDTVFTNIGVSMRQWIADRRSLIQGQLAATNAAAPFAITSSGGADFTTTNPIVTLAGVAPVAAEIIRVNGLPARVDWTTPVAWQVRLGLPPGTNVLQCEAVRRDGAVIGADAIAVASTAPALAPAGHVRISEIMYHPPQPEAEYVELFNTSLTDTFELGGCRLDGVTFTFPRGVLIAPRGHVVVAESEPGYAAAYTNAEVLAGAYAGNLADEGETVRLWAPVPGGGEVLVDSAPYDDRFPWPAAADGGGSALQRIDPAQDGRHPGVWTAVDPATNRQWTFVSVSGMTGSSPPATSAAQVRFFLQSPGSVAVDNVTLVAGAVAESGSNIVKNGQFEAGALTPWTTIGNHVRTTVSNAPVYAGTNSLLVTATDRGLSGTHNVRQGTLNLSVSSPYTLSYRYYPADNVDGLTAEVSSTSLRTTHSVAPPLPGTEPATPGRTNSVAQSLPALPDLWINEVLPVNAGGALDNAGEAEPWIELWNGSTARVDLAGLCLGTNPAALLAWPFPANAFVEAGEHLLVWADAETNETVSGAPHAPFRLSPAGGLVTLALNHGGQPILLDALTYPALPAGISIGSIQDGDSAHRQVFSLPSPAAANDGTSAPPALAINEWMSDNTRYPDPADGRKQDWFELFNPNPYPVSLGGYRLTDDPADPGNTVIPAGTWINGRGFLLVWADEEPGQTSTGGPVHAEFRLSNDGDAILLTATDGALVDAVSFGAQAANHSDGRWPDGAGAAFPMHGPTPGASNQVLQVRSTATTNTGFVVAWNGITGTIYRLEYNGGLLQTNWLPAGVTTAFTPTVQITDPTATTATQRFYRVRTD